MLVLVVVMLSSVGSGFYWFESKIGSFTYGIWSAFTTVATVGYGNVVPSRPASRIFEVFIVTLAYVILPILTASIVALFVGEKEE